MNYVVTFKNISVTSRRSVLLVKESEVPGDNHSTDKSLSNKAVWPTCDL
jgi:hypothetical protein